MKVSINVYLNLINILIDSTKACNSSLRFIVHIISDSIKKLRQELL